MMRERFDMLATVDEYVGKYVSNEWIAKNVLKMTDDESKKWKNKSSRKRGEAQAR